MSGVSEWKSESVVKFGPSVDDAVNIFVPVLCSLLPPPLSLFLLGHVHT